MVTVKFAYVLELTPQEFRLISSALQGNLREEWKADALALQDRMFQERNREVKTKLGNIAKLSEER